MSANSKNQHIQCESEAQLFALKDEFENYVGRDTSYDLGTLTLTVKALPNKYKKKTVRENKLRRARMQKDAEFSGDSDYADYDAEDYVA